MCQIVTVSFRKRQPTVREKPQKFLHDLSTLPIYCQSSKQLNTTQCVNILLDPELSTDSRVHLTSAVILCLSLI